ncbi:RNA polymerase sigma-70 factor [Olivibacter sp. XZL3]|uniref:RNA polymerase sigma-70 factor n=1 Tax=Olivibacter sp. XZL3 TaxID=1735116 RepID=UPI001065D5D0|nr:RNA polymerase sigma-70 factor [Olivibacter sp. XZL3]
MMNWSIRKKKVDLLSIEELFKRYYPRLFEFAYGLLGHEQEAEDIVQDAFVVFCEQQGRINWNDQAIKSYLYTTVKHDALNRIRHGRVVVSYQQRHQAPLAEENLILDHLIHSEVIGELMDALDKLPKGCALVCRLGYLEGLKNAQIAELMGVSIHTVKSQKQRALHLLKQQLGAAAFILLLAVLIR